MALSDDYKQAHAGLHSTFGTRINDAWGDMAASTRRLVSEQPSEARLLLFVLMSDVVFFLSWSLKAVVAPATGAVQHLPVEVSFWFIFALFCRTSAMYGLSIVIGLGAWVMGGSGTWGETRIAVFWGALVAAPIGFAFAVLAVVFAALEPQVPILSSIWIAAMPYWISMLAFVWFISIGLAEVHRFAKAGHVFAVISAIGVAGIFLAMYLRSNGVM